MKVVAQYAFTTQTDQTSAASLLISLDSMAREWSAKGRIDESWQFIDAGPFFSSKHRPLDRLRS